MIFGVLVIAMLVSCVNTKSQGSNDLVFEIEKTACFGECPVYTLSVYKDRAVILNAQQNLRLKGTYRSQLSDKRYQELVDLFMKHDFFSFKDRYTGEVTDLPTTFITFSHAGQSKKIMDYYRAPETLKSLESELHGLIDELSWTQMAQD